MQKIRFDKQDYPFIHFFSFVRIDVTFCMESNPISNLYNYMLCLEVFKVVFL